MIQDTKVIFDLPALAGKLHQPDGGSIKIAEIDFPKFREAAIAVPVSSLSCARKGPQRPIQRLFETAGAITIKLHSAAAQKCRC